MAKQVTEEVRQTTTADTGVETTTTPAPDPMGMAERVVYFFLAALEILLAFRFFLALMGANRGNAFADFIFDLSGVFVQPFFTLFNYNMQYGLSRFEFETLVAMAVYAVVAAGILALIRLPRGSATPTS